MGVFLGLREQIGGNTNSGAAAERLFRKDTRLSFIPTFQDKSGQKVLAS